MPIDSPKSSHVWNFSVETEANFWTSLNLSNYTIITMCAEKNGQ